MVLQQFIIKALYGMKSNTVIQDPQQPFEPFEPSSVGSENGFFIGTFLVKSFCIHKSTSTAEMFHFRRQSTTVPYFSNFFAADCLPTKVEHLRRRGRLVDIISTNGTRMLLICVTPDG